MITFNHEKYIREAIDGVLVQQTDFQIELILANDCSSDGTGEIIQNILETHPRAGQIRYFKHEKNLGMMPNFIFAFGQCQGKYIALCEGDDYWTDPLKLQKQVDFLEANPDYALCFHRVNILTNNGITTDEKEITEQRFNNIKHEQPLSKMDLLEQGNFIHTPSVVFRKDCLLDLPFEFSYTPVGDYLLYLLLTKKGYIKKINDVMAVYRKGTGMHSIQNHISMQFTILQYQSCLLSMLDNDEEKKIILNKQLKIIHAIKNQLSQKKPVQESSIKELIKILFKKIIH